MVLSVPEKGNICMKSLCALILAIGLMSLTACAVNPVTGEKELSLVSEAQELEAGRSQYAPSRQMQGGDYRLDPALTRYINEVGQRLAAVSDRRLPYEFKVINDSTPNAWALPGGKIAINRGLLLELESEAELVAVLGHEIVHAAARHGAKGMERGMLLQGAVLAAGVASGGSDYSSLAVGSAALGANLLNQRYSRDAEREADHYGIKYMARAGYDPTAAVHLQETFVRLAEKRQGNEGWVTGLFASHPPSRERVEQNRLLVRQLKIQGGDWGRERYRRMTAQLRRTKPAYDAFDEGRKALGKKRPKEALGLAEKAIRIEPQEALFYGLRGDAYFELGRQRKALKDYDRALNHDPDFFRYYVKRGLVREKQGDTRGAQRDFDRSLKLLPTAPAYFGLGRLALDSGQRQQAKDYFRKAAGSRSKDGQAAAKEFMRLDLADNTERYLKVWLAQDRSGRLVMQVKNSTKFPVQDVRVQLNRRDARGRLGTQRLFRVRGRVAPGDTVPVRTDIGPLASRDSLKGWVARPVNAQLVE
jgi:predicted Zn-dependent protease